MQLSDNKTLSTLKINFVFDPDNPATYANYDNIGEYKYRIRSFNTHGGLTLESVSSEKELNIYGCKIYPKDDEMPLTLYEVIYQKGLQFDTKFPEM